LEYSHTLVFTSIKVEHAGIYYCIGTKENGQHFSAKTEVIVAGNLDLKMSKIRNGYSYMVVPIIQLSSQY